MLSQEFRQCPWQISNTLAQHSCSKSNNVSILRQAERRLDYPGCVNCCCGKFDARTETKTSQKHIGLASVVLDFSCCVGTHCPQPSHQRQWIEHSTWHACKWAWLPGWHQGNAGKKMRRGQQVGSWCLQNQKGVLWMQCEGMFYKCPRH